MPTTLAVYYFSLISISLLQNETSSDFNGLGKKLLGGFALAVVVAVAYAFIKLRLRDKSRRRSLFPSILSSGTNEASKSRRE